MLLKLSLIFIIQIPFPLQFDGHVSEQDPLSVKINPLLHKQELFV